MKRISMFLLLAFTMMMAGHRTFAQEITITLSPGWNWISYPCATIMTLEEGLSGLTPAVGDVIKGMAGSSIYHNGSWQGNLDVFVPGKGYMYYSNNNDNVNFVFGVTNPLIVTTSDPTDITGNSANGGGNVTSNDGDYILAKGICWAAHQNPEANDDPHTENGTGAGSFTASMTDLTPSTVYYVRAYAVSSNGTTYGGQKSFTTRDGIPVVTTAEVTDISAASATCGGVVIDNGGLDVTDRGVCWSTTHNPTINDSHTSDGSGEGAYSSVLSGLSLNTTYYVRAYASTSQGTNYGDEQSFTTVSSAGQYVDLGLPSGILWAVCNLGAEGPEEFGDFYAWGETNSTHCLSDCWYGYHYGYMSESGWADELYKYNTSPNFGTVDNLTTLMMEDDAATANWGNAWRMPSKEEWEELINNTTSVWTTRNGVNGRLFTASNGNHLFLPAAGYSSHFSTEGGYYWSNSLFISYPFFAWSLDFDSVRCCVESYLNNSEYSYYYDGNGRCFGHSVRPVRCKNSVISVTANPADGGSVSGGGACMDYTVTTVSATPNEGYGFMCWTENGRLVSAEADYSFIVNGNRSLVANFGMNSANTYVDLGLPSGTLWASCNVGADCPEAYGDYFAWGETQPKDSYNWSTYQYCNGSYNTLTKYCKRANFGYNGFTDNLTTLLPEDDAATANWGVDWRMPTDAEWDELYNHTTHTWTIQNYVRGMLFTASNGNSIFLPAACYRADSGYGGIGTCHYWSSSLRTGYPCNANAFYSGADEEGLSDYDRCYGRTVRPVRSSR